MKARMIKIENNTVIKLGKVEIDILPNRGDKLVWKNDRDYIVKDILWDFFDNVDEVVIELETINE